MQREIGRRPFPQRRVSRLNRRHHFAPGGVADAADIDMAAAANSKIMMTTDPPPLPAFRPDRRNRVDAAEPGGDARGGVERRVAEAVRGETLDLD